MAAADPSTRSDFYVYALFRESGVPFYIGKGTGDRWACHERAARRGAWGRKYAIIRDMQARGVAVIKIKLHEGLTHEIANEYEEALISAIGRGECGPLVNLTKGGDGVTGVIQTPEHIAKRVTAIRGRKRSPEAIERTAAAHRGKVVSAETRAAIGLKSLGRKKSANEIAKMKAGLTGKKRTAETRARMVEGWRGRTLSPQGKANIRASKLGKPLSAAHRAKVSAGLTGRRQTPEHIENAAVTRRGKPWSAARRASHERNRAGS